MDSTQDWFLRQLTNITDGLRGIHDRKKQIEIPEPTNSITNDKILPSILKGLVENGQIDDAENLLFRCIENYPLAENYELGLDFYVMVASLPPEKLATAGWSRQEIKEGIADLYQIIFHKPLDIDTVFKEEF